MIERLALLENNIEELINFKNKYKLSDLKDQKNLEWALRYGFMESIQIIIDISCHLVNEKNLGNPNTYKDCIKFLKKYDYISNSIAETLSAMIGLRNILIHEYININKEQLYHLLDKLDDFKTFIAAISGYF
jgi:uncharacterized protein YutE (UPF0331/DUF86 family)